MRGFWTDKRAGERRTVDGEGRRRRCDDDAATATTKVGSPPDFFPSSRFPSYLQDCCMEIVWVFFAIY